MFHPFQHTIEDIKLPERFTFPFNYVPHPLSVVASLEVQSYLQTQSDWAEELKQGKMFGVLVVQTSDGTLGYLAAFSGILAGSYLHDYFVPPIYNLQHPEGFFKKEEEVISEINRQISQLEKSDDYQTLRIHRDVLKKDAEVQLECAKAQMKISKAERDRLRTQANITEIELQRLIRESQHQKAEYKRLIKSLEAMLDEAEANFQKFENNLQALKQERRSRSALLQQKLFQQFRVLNAKGEQVDLCAIFASTTHQVPPAGAGECAAPKLLQYAYLHHLKPLAMAEFWWGASSKSEIRIHGNYYPSCRNKCEPILGFMLQGLEVDPNPLEQVSEITDELEVLFDDEYLMVVNKPHGMLSVPGKGEQSSVYDYLSAKYPELTGPLMVHRLDMDTSGLLLIAKKKDIHAQLQQLFETRKIKKHYLALLDGELPTLIPSKGYIRLPLRPDYENRPYQLVDEIDGKPAITRYEVLGTMNREINGVFRLVTSIKYYPETGRTHQLRVHSAHPLGMNLPIVGDPLYGQKADRMYLHAAYLEFRHPVTGQLIKVEKPFVY